MAKMGIHKMYYTNITTILKYKRHIGQFGLGIIKTFALLLKKFLHKMFYTPILWPRLKFVSKQQGKKSVVPV